MFYTHCESQPYYHPSPPSPFRSASSRLPASVCSIRRAQIIPHHPPTTFTTTTDPGGTACTGHERSLTQIKFNHEGDLLFSCSKDHIINVWFSHNGERLGTYNAHNATVWTIDVDCACFLCFLFSLCISTSLRFFWFYNDSPIKISCFWISRQ